MIISIIGSQGTGKSTLASSLLQRTEFKDYQYCPSPVRYLYHAFRLDFHNANTELQLAILFMQQKYLSSSKNLILDRSVIDHWAYLQYYRNKGKSDVSDRCLYFIRMMTFILAEKVDIYFFLKREFPLEKDGVRITDEEQQKDIEEKIEAYLVEFNVRNRTHILTGSTEKRVLDLINIINKESLKQ